MLDDMARQTLSEAETTVRLRTPGEEDIWELQPAWSAEKLAKLPKPVQSRAIKLILQSGGIEPSALRINTAREIIASGKGKFNPCRGKFFVVRRGAAYIEYAGAALPQARKVINNHSFSPKFSANIHRNSLQFD